MLEQLDALEVRVSKNWDDQSAAGKVVAKRQGMAMAKAGEKLQKNFDEVIKQLESQVHFADHDLSVLERDHGLAVRAGPLLFDLIQQAELTSHSAGKKRKRGMFKVEMLDAGDFMRLSASTLEGLHVFQGGTSLFSVLNYTRTAGGERLLRFWLRQPLRRAADVRHRLDMVEALSSANSLRKTLHEKHLRRVPDLQRVCKRLQLRKLTLQDLYKAYCGVREAESLLQLLNEQGAEVTEPLQSKVLAPLANLLPHLTKYQRMCEETLDEDGLKDGEYKIKPSFDDELEKLAVEISGKREEMRVRGQKDRERLGMDDKVMKQEHSDQHGHYYRVTLKEERRLRGQKGVHIFDSTKAGVKFRTRELESLNLEALDLDKRYDLQQAEIVSEIIKIAETYHSHFLTLYGLISRLDCLVSLATAANSEAVPWTKPEIADDGQGVVVLKQARHPILEKMGVNFIPNDLTLDRKDKNFMIITGPNLGGKSTFMRTAGLCVYMAQVGSFVPCQSATITPVDSLLVRMGAGDDQFHGVSTFMAEMLDAARILRNSTSDSLVLIDELGRGTSTYDGFGLAWSISRHIAADIGASALFATHFHEMTAMAKGQANVGNLFCDALCEKGEFTLLYSVKPGICHQSFGVEVARLAGFPEDTLAAAEKYLRQSEKELYGFSGVKHLEEMEDLVRRMEEGKEDKDKLKEEAKRLMSI